MSLQQKGKNPPNLYEGMYIISASLSDEARTKALDKITEGIAARGGVVHKVHDQGRRKLAYTINGRREGWYYLLYFSLSPSVITELWNEYHFHEDLIRFMTLRTEAVRETIEFKALAELT